MKLSRDNLAHIKKQIVRSEESESDEKKDQAYLSDKTRSFDRESVAKRIDTFKPSAQGSPKKSITKRSEDIKLSDLGAYPKSENPFKKAAREYSKSKNGLVNGNPDVRGISSTNDYIKEVPAGDFTHLNTVEFKYYGFYHRIRQKLEQFWGRSIQEKAEILIKDGRRVPASEELITALQVTMDRDGEIIAIKVKGSSGVKELDDAAIESFNDAGPFPNPPKDLIVNGKVTVEWGFVVKS
ncbi:MAG TPA: energy transducer TonB [Bacteriovoracaceae bacterium]|nr:energy transducer TonB [Bacteriovoracaceae bacterium]